MAYWLMKSEAGTYGWDELVRAGRTQWDGVRNPTARIHLRSMDAGDEAFFYHSGDQRQIVGIMRITGPAQPDGDDGNWAKVPVEPVRSLGPVPLKAIKADPRLAGMELVRNSRLSVSPVREEEWRSVLQLASAGENEQ